MPPARASYGGYGGPPTGPRRQSRAGLWIGIAAAAVIIIGAAIAVPLLLRSDHDGTAAGTTDMPPTTSTTVLVTTTSSTTTSSTASTSTTVTTAGAPGDSAGAWVEMDIPGLPAGAYVVAVSDQAMLIDAGMGDGYALYAYLFDSGMLVELPIDASEFYGEDLDGLLAVWWEGEYDEDTGRSFDEHVCSFRLPDGPKVEVAAEEGMSYPQVAGEWITWVEADPWEENPDEYWLLKVYGVKVDPSGAPVGEPVELVSSATGFALGDSVWTYSLSDTHIAWEQAAPVGLYDTGTYTMDLSTLQPLVVGDQAWRPSVQGDNVVYYQDGLKATDLVTGEVREIDPSGDFAAAAPTFATYFRSVETDGESNYEIVARGYTGSYEQVLGRQSEPPWFSPLIAASGTHVAFAVDGVVHVFEWQGQ